MKNIKQAYLKDKTLATKTGHKVSNELDDFFMWCAANKIKIEDVTEDEKINMLLDKTSVIGKLNLQLTRAIENYPIHNNVIIETINNIIESANELKNIYIKVKVGFPTYEEELAHEKAIFSL